MGFLKKLFGGKEAQFQALVLETVRSHYPAVQMEAGAGAMSARLNGVDLDLQRLFAVCEQNQTQAADFVRQYFSYPAALCLRAGKLSPADAEARVRPQLVPEEFAQRFGVFNVPVVAGIASALVLKADPGSPFLRPEEIEAAGLRPEALYARALENLDADPMEMEVTITDGTDRFIGMETHDGFDAVRVLLPRVREFAAKKIGLPCLAGIPNSGFLILWSRECSPRFQDYAAEKIETDYTIQPYPLSKARFELTDTGLRSNH